jgi:hypothetical protein
LGSAVALDRGRADQDRDGRRARGGVGGGAAGTPAAPATRGRLIRRLEDGEKALRAKWAARVVERREAVQRAVAELQEAQSQLHDLALAFNRGRPVVMTEVALYEVPDGA